MINLYLHGGSGNHGCEAIVRSTIKMLNEPVKVFSDNVEQDIQYGLDELCNLQENVSVSINRGNREWLFSAIQTKLTGKIDLLIKYRYKNLFRDIKPEDIFISVGGDNYCYAGTDILAAMNNCLRGKRCKTVLWGCSVEPELLYNPEIAKDIAAFDLITARESISYQALKEVNKNTYLVSDPAFTLDRIDLPLPEGWKRDNMIGINASPLILSSANSEAVVLEAYRKLILKVLEATDCGIALIPHVVWKKNDDRVVLRQFYEEFKNTGRILLLDDYNCMELKGFIARCRMFIGARTHATIAAYSNCVPTLVLGYSVKSRGIAKDIFGTEENYVIPVQGISDTNALADGFLWLLNNENDIYNQLQVVMPKYTKKAFDARLLLDRL